MTENVSDVEFQVQPKPSLMTGLGTIPSAMLNELNEMCDDLLADPDTPSYANPAGRGCSTNRAAPAFGC